MQHQRAGSNHSSQVSDKVSGTHNGPARVDNVAHCPHDNSSSTGIQACSSSGVCLHSAGAHRVMPSPRPAQSRPQLSWQATGSTEGSPGNAIGSKQEVTLHAAAPQKAPT